MQLVPKAWAHKKTQLLQLNFTAAGSTSVDVATGLRAVPVYWTISASAAGSAAVYAGTSGSELIRLKFGAADPKSGYYWDNETTAGNPLVVEVEGGVGVGQFNVYYLVVRRNAGDSGTAQ